MSLKFFNFVSKGLYLITINNGGVPARFRYSGDAALQLIMRAYNNQALLRKLISAYFLYENLKPEEIDIQDNSVASLAKYTYVRLSMLNDGKGDMVLGIPRNEATPYLWALALLNVVMYDDPKFQHMKDNFLQNYNKFLSDYRTITKFKTSRELAKINKDLAIRKWLVDRDLVNNPNPGETGDYSIQDKYAVALVQSIDAKTKEDFESALSKNDKTVEVVALKKTKEVSKVYMLSMLGVGIITISLIVIKRRKIVKKNEKSNSRG